MPITAYDAAIPPFVRALTNLKGILKKAEQQTGELGVTQSELLESRLAPPAPDTLQLASQVHWAAEGAKRAIERLTGIAFASTNDDAKTFAELQQRLDTAIMWLETVSPSALEAGLAREIDIENRGGRMHFKGDKFLREFALPHFYFHVTCAYTILRNRGIKLKMADFLGPFD